MIDPRTLPRDMTRRGREWLTELYAANAWTAPGEDGKDAYYANEWMVRLFNAVTSGPFPGSFEAWDALTRAVRPEWAARVCEEQTAASGVPWTNPWPVPIPPPIVSLPRLVLNGRFFALEDGTRWTAIESSEFRLYERYLKGEDLTPVLTERRDLGFNLLRVWLLNTSVGHILPWEHPDFYPRLPAFGSLCASFGLYPDFTVFTQTQTLMPELVRQQDHWDRSTQALINTAGLVAAVNEHDQHDNAIHPLLVLHKPEGARFLISRGSNGADSVPPRPTLDAEEYHTNDLSEWWRKAGHNSMEWADQSGHPCWASENTRCPDKDSNPAHFMDAAAGAALLCAGACFHSEGGKQSRLFDATERACALAWVNGARSVPLEYQAGAYHHRTELEGPGIIRVYDRTLSDGRQWIVKIRK